MFLDFNPKKTVPLCLCGYFIVFDVPGTAFRGNYGDSPALGQDAEHVLSQDGNQYFIWYVQGKQASEFPVYVMCHGVRAENNLSGADLLQCFLP